MACKTSCKLCNRLVISTAVGYSADEGLIIRIPDGPYANGEKYCIVIAQAIPTNTPITAPVVISIGPTSTVRYPLNNCDCSQATACQLRTRTRYATRVATTAAGGSFRLLGKICCAPDNALPSIGG